LSFRDSSGIPDFVQMETLNIKIVCPVLRKEQEINIGRLKELTQELQFKGNKVYIFPNGVELQEIRKSCSDVIQLRDLKHIKTFKTTDERTYESWYYGNTIVTKNDLLIKCALRRVTKSIEIQVSGNDDSDITGLLAKIGHDLIKEFEARGKVQPVFNLHIKDYIVNRSDLLNFCDNDGNISGNILIENIVVKRSNLPSENSGKSRRSETEGDENQRREKEQQIKTDRLGRKQDDNELFERNKKQQPDKNMLEEEAGQGDRGNQEKTSQENTDVKMHDKEEQEHRPGQKEPQENDDDDRIELIRKISGQRIEIKTTIINKTVGLSNSGYQEERGVNFEGIGVDKLVGSLIHVCKKMLYLVEEYPIENGRLLYLASDAVDDKAYYLLTAVIREYEGLTQVLLRADSDKNYGVNGLLNDILEKLRHSLIRPGAKEIGIISKEQVTIIIDSVVRSLEEERARRKREEQERLREEEAKKRKKEKELRQKEQEEKEEKEQGKKKEQKETKSKDIAKQEQESIKKADLSSSKKKERLFLIIFLAIVLMSVFLVLEYWVLAPFASDTNRSLGSSSTLPGSFTNFNNIEFVLIPAGDFDMGSPLNEANRVQDEGPVHRVIIPDAFYMGRYEVTQKQWREVMGNNPSTFKGDNLPVEQVSWNDVQEFIKKLNENEHVTKYRLPTEAQWEYAARAGDSMMYFFGDNVSKLGDYAWYIGNSEGKTHNIGLKKPNPFGLYDIHGNVYEWVQDSYFDSYKVPPKDASVGEYVSSSRVFRGGSWISNAASCRPANREENEQGNRGSNLGFRLMRDL
jgi:formylglycine-generating enzyme required for sulfatase activity